MTQEGKCGNPYNEKAQYSLIDDFIHHRDVSVQLNLSRTIDYQISECKGTNVG